MVAAAVAWFACNLWLIAASHYGGREVTEKAGFVLVALVALAAGTTLAIGVLT